MSCLISVKILLLKRSSDVCFALYTYPEEQSLQKIWHILHGMPPKTALETICAFVQQSIMKTEEIHLIKGMQKQIMALLSEMGRLLQHFGNK